MFLTRQLFTRQPKVLHPIFIAAPYKPKPHNPSWRKALIVCGVMISSLLLMVGVNANAKTGELTFLPNASLTSPANNISPLHLSTHIDASVNGIIAQVTYTQSFSNPSPNWQEGVYTFPLPSNASVNHMEIHIDERIIIGEIKERAEAQKIYTQAKQQGKRAALTEQQRPNIFTQKIANIGPNQTVKVVLRFIQPIEYASNQFEWRLPTTITPRYIPHPSIATQPTPNLSTQDKHFGWAQATTSVPDAHLITPPVQAPSAKKNTFSLNIHLNSGVKLANIDALYHDIVIKKNSSSHAITLKNTTAIMDRDFVLQWKPVLSSMPQAAFFSEHIAGEHYGLLMMLPPQAPNTQTLMRDVVFIIDTSGSMQGNSIEQAKQSLLLAISRLKTSDRFNIIEFNSSTSTLYDDYTEVNSHSIEYARHWVKQLHANGGTEMLPALQAAFNHTVLSDHQSERLQQIIFITDGAVGNEKPLFNSIHQNLNSARLFTVGIGSAPNNYFMRKAADFGRGSFTFIANTPDIQQKMGALFNHIESAYSQNIQVQWQTHAEQYPEKISDLYAGQPLIIPVKLTQLPSAITVTGQISTGPWQQTISIDPNTQNHHGISSLWARSKIQSIEDQATIGAISQQQAKTHITQTALTHNLLTRFTSFVAVEQEPVRTKNQALNSAALPNPAPKNTTSSAAQSNQALSPITYPQTASWGGFSFWFGVFCFLGYLFMHAIRNEP